MYVCFSIYGTSKDRTIKGVINKTTIEDIMYSYTNQAWYSSSLTKDAMVSNRFAKNVGYLRIILEIQNI